MTLADAEPVPAGPRPLGVGSLRTGADRRREVGRVHTTRSTSSGGGATLTVTGVSGQDDGSQVFNQTTSFGDEKFTLLLLPDQTVYFQGNAAAAEDQLGVSASAASGVAGQWVSVQIGDGPYKNLEVGITVGSQLSEAALDATSTETVTGSGGTQLTRILGTVPGTPRLRPGRPTSTSRRPRTSPPPTSSPPATAAAPRPRRSRRGEPRPP